MNQDTDAQKLDRIRAKYVAQLVQIGGKTRAEAHEIFDLAWHASSEAQQTLASVCGRAADKVTCMSLAMVFTGKAMRAGLTMVAERAFMDLERDLFE